MPSTLVYLCLYRRSVSVGFLEIQCNTSSRSSVGSSVPMERERDGNHGCTAQSKVVQCLNGRGDVCPQCKVRTSPVELRQVPMVNRIIVAFEKEARNFHPPWPPWSLMCLVYPLTAPLKNLYISGHQTWSWRCTSLRTLAPTIIVPKQPSKHYPKKFLIY